MTRVYEGGAQFVLKISGKDHVDLLHRVTSNDVRGLAVGSENFQCLLTAKGKIIVPFRMRRESDHVVISGPGALKETAIKTIDQYIFSEDVQLLPMDDRLRPDDDDARIRAGLPKWGVDINEETIPWEAGLSEYVSTSKGCYTGQETIARIETYGRVARRLVKLIAVTDEPDSLESITSVTSAPPRVALAMVKRDVAAGAIIDGWEVEEL